MERHFLYAAVWAFGGHLSPSHQILFDYWLRSKCRKQLDEELPIPEAGNVSNLTTCVCVCVYVYSRVQNKVNVVYCNYCVITDCSTNCNLPLALSV